MDDPAGKRCCTCHETKPLQSFNRHKREPDGRQPQCRDCYKLWYQKNRKRHRANVQLAKGYPERVCAECGEEFVGRRLICGACVYRRNQKPCPACGNPMSCRAETCKGCTSAVSKSGDRNANWKGGTTRHSHGYVQIRLHGKYIFEHVLVMQSHIGRPLTPGETVHHRNGVRCDNRIENLELWSSPHGTGIRAVEALAWAREVVEKYEPLEKAGLL